MLPVYMTGNRAAPNGQIYEPLFTLKSEFNLSLMSDRQAYLFWDSAFWGQKAAAGVTNASQGQWDFSKREIDNNIGLAAAPTRNLEMRASVYAMDNLNRGTNLITASGQAWGVIVEGRRYFGPDDIGPGAERSYLDLGMYPSGDLIDPSGSVFNAGLFAGASGRIALPVWLWDSYAFGKLNFISQRMFKPRLMESDFGLATRPFAARKNLEIRLGFNNVYDLTKGDDAKMAYGAFRIGY